MVTSRSKKVVARTMSAKEYFEQATDGHTLSARITRAAKEIHVAYGTLFRHVVYAAPVRVDTAMKLEGLDPRISAIKVLGLEKSAREFVKAECGRS